MYQLLRSGDIQREYNGKKYPSRSEPLQGLAVAAVNCRWTFGEYRREIRKSPLFAKLAERDDKDRFLRRCWKNALEFVRMNPPKNHGTEHDLVRAIWR